ncbi:MAG: hypothetical protein P1U56_19995 [Saprospiraceae bacterium]|nr:hypothetical protein [Saprospiraceae bacterium]
MYKFLTKNGQTMALGLGVLVIAIFLISIFMGFSDMGYNMSTDLNKLSDAEQADIGFFDAGIKLTVFMIAISFLLAFVVFGIFDLIKFPKNAIKFAIGALGLAIVFYALYATSSFDTGGRLTKLNDDFAITPAISKFISGGIKTTLGLLGFSVFAVIVGELWALFK